MFVSANNEDMPIKQKGAANYKMVGDEFLFSTPFLPSLERIV
jgi:hypothetical protein